MRDGDVVRDIQNQDFSRFNLDTAEGRADFDDFLRDLIHSKTGDDETLRRHVGQMLRKWREKMFEGQGE